MRESGLREVRRAYAALLRDRITRSPSPVLLPPPEPDIGYREAAVGGGCMLCSVRGVWMAAADVGRLGWDVAQASVWRAVSLEPSALGGRGPNRLAGHVCDGCSDAVDLTGSTGQSAMQRSLLAYLRDSPIDGHRRKADELSGHDFRVVGWGAVADRGPSRQRAGHLELTGAAS